MATKAINLLFYYEQKIIISACGGGCCCGRHMRSIIVGQKRRDSGDFSQNHRKRGNNPDTRISVQQMPNFQHRAHLRKMRRTYDFQIHRAMV